MNSDVIMFEFRKIVMKAQNFLTRYGRRFLYSYVLYAVKWSIYYQGRALKMVYELN